jgi:hypothetical protein
VFQHKNPSTWGGKGKTGFGKGETEGGKGKMGEKTGGEKGKVGAQTPGCETRRGQELEMGTQELKLEQNGIGNHR